MADEGRTFASKRKQCQCTKSSDKERVKKLCRALFVFVLLVLLPAVETARTINACGRGRRRCAMRSVSHVTGSNHRRLSPSNQFNVPSNGPGRPQTTSTTANRYNASKHEVPSGPNPISNR